MAGSSDSLAVRTPTSTGLRQAAARYRRARHRRFETLLAQLPPPVRILDVGGTPQFWVQSGTLERHHVEIVLLNLTAQRCDHPRLRDEIGSAVDLSRFPDRSFDVVFSNSVIEHLFTWESQRRMAAEVRRVGHSYWIQTPNFWFPLEPHFRFVGWQWLPVPFRAALLRHFRFGHRGPCPRADAARASVEEIRLLTLAEMRSLFPDARIWRERACGLVKSFVAHRGFGSSGAFH